MITNVELEIKLSAKEVLQKLFPGISKYVVDDYDILYVSGGNTDYGRKPVNEVVVRLRKKLKDGKIL